MINQYFLTRKIFSGNNFEILILSFYLPVKCWEEAGESVLCILCQVIHHNEGSDWECCSNFLPIEIPILLVTRSEESSSNEIKMNLT